MYINGRQITIGQAVTSCDGDNLYYDPSASDQMDLLCLEQACKTFWPRDSNQGSDDWRYLLLSAILPPIGSAVPLLPAGCGTSG